jgi:hypothetical protein
MMKINATLGKSGSCVLRAIPLVILYSGCGQQMDMGSDVLWTARYEGNNFLEWTTVPGGGAGPPSALSTMAVSSERWHQGNYSANLTVYAPADTTQGNASFAREGNLPVQAYYSAWYYLPRSVTVGVYWVIMKFRLRRVVDDPTSEDELFDVNLKSLNDGGMSLRLYVHQQFGGGDWPLDVPDPPVSVGDWFQLEAFYRVASDSSGRLTLWLDGKQILDKAGPTGPTPWVAWDVVSVAQVLNPETATIFIDDCAVSNTRVGISGQLGN